MTAPEELKYWVALNRIAGLGRVRYSLLQNHFPSMEEAWRAGVSELKAAGLGSKLAGRGGARGPGGAATARDEERERLASSGITALTWQDPAYPPRLKEIYDLPPVLYVRGRLTAADEWCVAVVGTRRPMPHARPAAAGVTSGLAANSICVVGGLARGVGSIAPPA